MRTKTDLDERVRVYFDNFLNGMVRHNSRDAVASLVLDRGIDLLKQTHGDVGAAERLRREANRIEAKQD